MVIKPYIFSYNRPEMLAGVYSHLRSFDLCPTIYDDGSDFDLVLPNLKIDKHRGKEGFWFTWNKCLVDAEATDADIYLFMPDDFENINIPEIKEIHTQLKHRPYAHNIINDGRNDKCWTNIRATKQGDNRYRVGWVDCGFFCNREALEEIGFYMARPPRGWFARREGISSGVGMMLTHRLNEARVACYRPIRSLAEHGEHESMMHPEERKKNKLKSL